MSASSSIDQIKKPKLSLYYLFTASRIGMRGRELMGGVGKTMMQSGGTFGTFMAIGMGIRCWGETTSFYPTISSYGTFQNNHGSLSAQRCHSLNLQSSFVNKGSDLSNWVFPECVLWFLMLLRILLRASDPNQADFYQSDTAHFSYYPVVSNSTSAGMIFPQSLENSSRLFEILVSLWFKLAKIFSPRVRI